jgi:hypothetical protein
MAAGVSGGRHEASVLRFDLGQEQNAVAGLDKNAFRAYLYDIAGIAAVLMRSRFRSDDL